MNALKVIVVLASAILASAEFDGRVYHKTVFATGHVFSWGQCAAVATQISKDCYKGMPDRVADRVSTNSTEIQTCVTHIHKTPCLYGEMKYTAETSGHVDCGELVLLYEDAMEECLRKAPDARFWASIGYWIAIMVGIMILGSVMTLCSQCLS